MIVLYSTNCPKCIVVETKMKQLNLDYTVVEDKDEVVEVAKAHGFVSAPVLRVDDNYYDFAGAISYLRGVSN